MNPVESWELAVASAWKLAYGERMNELHDERRPRLLDERGLHPYSEVWGQIILLEAVPEVATFNGEERTLLLRGADPAFGYEAGRVSPFELKEAARRAASVDYAQEIIDNTKGDEQDARQDQEVAEAT